MAKGISRSRPERIELGTPSEHAQQFREMLQKQLHPRARLMEKEKDGRTTFIFYPTKGEYLLVSILTSAIGKSLGAEKQET